jgi:hypothetical protein
MAKHFGLDVLALSEKLDAASPMERDNMVELFLGSKSRTRGG